MNEKVPTVSSSDSVVKAANLLVEKNNPRVVVLENEEIMGIVSAADIIRKIMVSFKENYDVKDFYLPAVATVWERTPLDITGRILYLSGQHALPVLGKFSWNYYCL